MHLLYEHHISPEGEILATDMMMTSVFPGRPYVNWQSAIEKAIFEFIKRTFKDVHIKNRTYDADTNIWGFFPPFGQAVYDTIKASPLCKVALTIERVEDLIAQKRAAYIKRPALSRIDPKDFFYTPEPTAPSGPSRDEIKTRLAALLNLNGDQMDSSTLSQLKKPYRIAALQLHPDRNNGDGSRMSELNYLWQAWQPYAAPEPGA